RPPPREESPPLPRSSLAIKERKSKSSVLDAVAWGLSVRPILLSQVSQLASSVPRELSWDRGELFCEPRFVNRAGWLRREPSDARGPAGRSRLDPTPRSWAAPPPAGNAPNGRSTRWRFESDRAGCGPSSGPRCHREVAAPA